MAKKLNIIDLKILIEEETRKVLEEASMRDRLKGLAAAGALAGGIGGGIAGAPEDNLRKVQPVPTFSTPSEESEEELELPGGDGEEPEELPSAVEDTRAINLGMGYDALDYAADLLQRNAPKIFNGDKPLGRATLGLAALLGGLETLGRGASTRDPFTITGGETLEGVPGRMVGFAQFHADKHAKEAGITLGPKTDAKKPAPVQSVNPSTYSNHLGRVLQGLERQPNGGSPINFAAKFLQAVKDETVRDNATLRAWAASSKLGGSNWDAVDGDRNGWGRVPGLAEQIINYVRAGLDMPPVPVPGQKK